MKGTLFILAVFFSTSLLSQTSETQRKLFLHADYQICKYDYLQVAVGFNPKKHLVSINRNNAGLSFLGYRVSYAKNFNNSDWGLAVQSIALGGDFGNILAVGGELNYKSVDRRDHFGLKPLIGLSFPYVSVMYGYNIDLYEVKADRVSQHEIIVGLDLAIFKW